MADVAAIVPSEILGFKATDDKKHGLVGMRLADGQELALAVTPDSIDMIISALISVKSLFPNPSRIGPSEEFAITLQKFDFGHKASTDQLFLRLRPVDGGHIGFVFDRTFATQLSEQLQAVVGPMAPPPENPRN